jgi:hypothetical protein
MFGNISIWQLLTIKGFRKGMEEEDGTQETAEQLESADQASAGTEQAPESKQTEASKDS